MLKYSWKKIHTLYKQHEILRVFTAVFSVDALVKAVGLLLLPVYLKLMSEAEFGLYNYVLTITGMCSAILGFGMFTAQNKMYFDSSEKVERGKVLYSVNFLLTILLSAVLIILYFTKLDYLIIQYLIKSPINYQIYRSSFFLTIISLVYMNMLSSFLLLEKKVKTLQVYNFLRLILINSIVIALFIILKSDKIFIRLFYVALIEMLILVLFYSFYIKKMIYQISFTSIKKALIIGVPFTLAAIPAMVIGFFDKFFVEKYTSVHHLSVYYLAFTISGVIPAIFVSIQNVWQPFFYNEKNILENRRKTKRLLLNLILVFPILSVFLIIGTKLALILNIFDQQYSEILFVLPIMLLNQIVISLCTIIGGYIIYFNRTYIYLILNIILFFPILFLTKFMTQKYELYGAIFATLLSSVSYLIVYLLVVKQLFDKALILLKNDKNN